MRICLLVLLLIYSGAKVRIFIYDIQAKYDEPVLSLKFPNKDITPEQFKNNKNSITDALQESINWAVKYKANLVLNGKYVIDTTIIINGSITIRGNLKTMSSIIAKKAIVSFYIHDANNVKIENLKFEGIYKNGVNNTRGGLIRGNNISNCEIVNCAFFNSGSSCVGLTNAHDIEITRCNIKTSYFSGIRINDPGSGNTNKNIIIRDCNIRDVVHSRQAGHAGIFVSSAIDGLQANKNITIEKNIVNSWHVGIGLDAVTNANISFNNLSGNGVSGEGIAVTGNNINIYNNKIKDFGAAGILWFVTGDKNQGNIKIISNYCWDNNSGIETVFASDTAFAKKLVVQFNKCWSTYNGKMKQKYGFQLYKSKINKVSGGDWEDVEIINNDFSKNTIAPYTILQPYINKVKFKENIK